MSFKREGDDWCLLNNLKKHRVSNLLSLHIPEDEAILTRNGRYSCLICPHRPVFDTINVLAVHRGGKKHLMALSQRLKRENTTSALPVDDTSSKNYDDVRSKLYTAKKNRFGRKRVLEVESEESAGQSRTTTDATLSSKTINSYLNKMEKKRNFTELVDKRRRFSNLNDNSSCKEIDSVVDKKEQKREQITKSEPRDVVQVKESEEKEYYLKLRESGWCKNQNGEWIRENDVEFDSDEDEPQNYEKN